MFPWTRMIVVGVVLLLAPAALAGDLDGPDRGATFLGAGLLLSASKRSEEVMPAMGAELSVHHYIDNGTGIGLFGQWQSMEFEHNRFAGGFQLSHSIAGLELGMARETARDGRAATTMLHLAPYASVGIAALALRFGIPIQKSGRELLRHGYDVGLVLAIKAPVPLTKR
jgi:hypothetical protein